MPFGILAITKGERETVRLYCSAAAFRKSAANFFNTGSVPAYTGLRPARRGGRPLFLMNLVSVAPLIVDANREFLQTVA